MIKKFRFGMIVWHCLGKVALKVYYVHGYEMGMKNTTRIPKHFERYSKIW